MKLNAKEFEELLEKEDACDPGKKWAKGKSLETVWTTLDNPSWMMWLLCKMWDEQVWPTKKEVLFLTCDIAESVLPIYEKKFPNDDRVRKCVEGTRKFLNGEIEMEELIKLRNAADADADADAADADADDAAAAAYVAYAAAYAGVKVSKKVCDLIRSKINLLEARK